MDESLWIWWDPFFVLNFALYAFYRITADYIDSESLASQSLYKDLEGTFGYRSGDPVFSLYLPLSVFIHSLLSLNRKSDDLPMQLILLPIAHKQTFAPRYHNTQSIFLSLSVNFSLIPFITVASPLLESSPALVIWSFWHAYFADDNICQPHFF